MESGQVLFVLASASKALKGEAALRAAGVPCALIPVPRTLTSQCGVCLRVDAVHRNRADGVLAEAGMTIASIHEVEGRPARPAGPRGSNDD
jgi:hypothetical protein